MPCIRPGNAAVIKRVARQDSTSVFELNRSGSSKPRCVEETSKKPPNAAWASSRRSSSAALSCRKSMSRTLSLARVGSHEELVIGEPLECKLNIFDETLRELQSIDVEEGVAESRLNFVIGVIIIINTLVLGLELELGPQDASVDINDRLIWFVIESIFICLFLGELLVRIAWERSHWIRSLWNWLDLFVVVSAVVESWILPSLAAFMAGSNKLSMVTLLRIVRIMRLIRVVRLVRMFRGMYAMVIAFQEAMSSMVWVCCIMAIGMYVCAIFTTTVIGRNPDLMDVKIARDTAKDRFGTLPRSIYSLFELMTLEGWHQVGRPLVMQRPALFLFIFAYIMVFTFGLLNMIVAVIVEKTLSSAKTLEALDSTDHTLEQVQSLLQMRELFSSNGSILDGDSEGCVTHSQFVSAVLANEELRNFLVLMGLPSDDPEGVWSVLDVHGADVLSVTDLISGCLQAEEKMTKTVFWEVAHTNGASRAMLRQMRNMSSELWATHDRQEAAAIAANTKATEEAVSMSNDEWLERAMAALQKLDARVEAAAEGQAVHAQLVQKLEMERTQAKDCLDMISERLSALAGQGAADGNKQNIRSEENPCYGRFSFDSKRASTSPY
eukprot:TRINITY_DN38354_c0_g1_i1.p1 TRINITY_DN38354_c0_g1~~TRINITY_DN38354_c0_g1_i1.p1  ORF type:complete len:610 (-),score=115.20 TRINITY_DN38354_c0_g1_i1:190-2019(-)